MAKVPDEVNKAIASAVEGAKDIEDRAEALGKMFSEAQQIKEKREKDIKDGKYQEVSVLGNYSKELLTNTGVKVIEDRIIQRGCDRDEKVILIQDIAGLELVDQLGLLARGRNVHIMDMLVPSIEAALSSGDFQAAHGAGRKGVDEDDASLENVRLKEVLGLSVYNRIKDHARGMFCSNQHAFVSGLQDALAKATI